MLNTREKEKKISKADQNWRRGYDLGVQNTLRDNDRAIKIGRAILDVLNGLYEFKKEDY